MGVVRVVLVHPPAEAEPAHQVPVDQAEDPAPAQVAGHLQVTDVVTEEPDLGGDHAEDGGQAAAATRSRGTAPSA